MNTTGKNNNKNIAELITITLYLLSKIYFSVNSPFLQISGFFVNLSLISETVQGNTALLSGCSSSNLAIFPSLIDIMKVVRQSGWWSAKLHTSSLGNCKAFRLALSDIGSLVLCHKGKHPKHGITKEGTYKVLASSGTKQRHSLPLQNVVFVQQTIHQKPAICHI